MSFIKSRHLKLPWDNSVDEENNDVTFDLHFCHFFKLFWTNYTFYELNELSWN